VRISVSLADSATFFDGVLFALLLAILTALLWKIPLAKFRDPLTIFTGILALATFGLVYVSWLQSRTLDKTDETFRAGERAFVFPKQIGTIWTPAQVKNGVTYRSVPLEWENNGNSQSKRLIIELNCPRPTWSIEENPMKISDGNFGKSPRMIGPKQTIIGGTCGYSDNELKTVQNSGKHLYIAAKATYDDIFGDPHVTEYCGEIVNITGDVSAANVTPQNDTQICGRNCADEECKKP
jgi:hypothetical protein